MYTLNMAVAWDPEKARQNLRKHGVRFADAILDLEDPYAVTISDHESEPSEMRWVTLGADAQGRVLVRWETPRLCRGGSRSLTCTAVSLTLLANAMYHSRR